MAEMRYLLILYTFLEKKWIVRSNTESVCVCIYIYKHEIVILFMYIYQHEIVRIIHMHKEYI